MPTTTRFSVAGTLVLGAVLAWAPAASADPGERVTAYDVSVTIAADGDAHVVETIAYDFGTNQRHGITRQVLGHTLSGSATASSPDGAPAAATTTGNIIRVGDPTATVTGAHTYVLTYDVPAAVTVTGTNASLDWDVVDGSWDVPMSSVNATITAPAAATLNSCSLSAAPPCTTTAANGNTIHVHQDNVSPHQTMTAMAAFPAAGLPLATLPPTSSAPLYSYPTPSWNAASSSSTSSSSGSSAIVWLVGLGVVGVVIAGLVQAANGSGRRGRGSSWSDSGGSSYNSFSDSGSSWSDSSSSGSSDSGSSSSSCGSGSW